MGWAWEVAAYLEMEPPNALHPYGGYAYVPVYQGNSWWRALLAARKAKRRAGCVKVEWR